MKDWSFMEMYIHVRDDMNQVLAFNPNTYGKFEPVRKGRHVKNDGYFSLASAFSL